METRAGATREGTAKATVADQISQAVQSTSNLLHLMQQSSPSQAHLMKLPRKLLAKASTTTKNTGQVLEQMPQIISSLDAHIDNGLQSVSHLDTVIQLLSNMESCQLNSASQAHQSGESEQSAIWRYPAEEWFERGCSSGSSYFDSRSPKLNAFVEKSVAGHWET